MTISLEPMLPALKQAVMLCREVQHRFLYSATKINVVDGGTEPVTMADYGSQAILCKALSELYPDDAILAEEQGDQFLELVSAEGRAQILGLLTTILDIPVTQEDVVRWLDFGRGKKARRVWAIDPIDGTKGFIAMRHYAVGLGLLVDGQPSGGAIGCPGYGDGVSGYDEDGALFFTREDGVYLQAYAGGSPTRVQVSARTEPSLIRIVQSVEEKHASKARMERVRELAGLAQSPLRELDSMEKYALIAAGEADLYIRLPNLDNKYQHKIWDHAAGTALVLAAGGVVTDVDGSPLDFSRGDILPNSGMLVSNGHIHERILNATQALLNEERKE